MQFNDVKSATNTKLLQTTEIISLFRYNYGTFGAMA